MDNGELIRDSWRRVGSSCSRNRRNSHYSVGAFSGDALMSIDWGLENGLATAAMSPGVRADEQGTRRPKWGQYETHGKAGEPPDLPKATKLRELYAAWLDATTQADQARIWQEMLKIWSEEVYTIGLVAGVLQPVVVSGKLRNVPEEANYNWDPGAHFGIYKPDGFWLDTQKTPASSAALTR
jgi:peptide/nickel transport system substrate-binding protein